MRQVGYQNDRHKILNIFEVNVISHLAQVLRFANKTAISAFKAWFFPIFVRLEQADASSGIPKLPSLNTAHFLNQCHQPSRTGFEICQ